MIFFTGLGSLHLWMYIVDMVFLVMELRALSLSVLEQVQIAEQIMQPMLWLSDVVLQ